MKVGTSSQVLPSASDCRAAGRQLAVPASAWLGALSERLHATLPAGDSWTAHGSVSHATYLPAPAAPMPDPGEMIAGSALNSLWLLSSGKLTLKYKFAAAANKIVSVDYRSLCFSIPRMARMVVPNILAVLLKQTEPASSCALLFFLYMPLLQSAELQDALSAPVMAIRVGFLQPGLLSGRV